MYTGTRTLLVRRAWSCVLCAVSQSVNLFLNEHKDSCLKPYRTCHLARWRFKCVVIVLARAGSQRLGPGASRSGGSCGGWAAGGGGGRPTGLRAFLEIPPLVVKPVLYLGRVERLQAELLLAWLGLGARLLSRRVAAPAT